LGRLLTEKLPLLLGRKYGDTQKRFKREEEVLHQPDDELSHKDQKSKTMPLTPPEDAE